MCIWTLYLFGETPREKRHKIFGIIVEEAFQIGAVPIIKLPFVFVEFSEKVIA